MATLEHRVLALRVEIEGAGDASGSCCDESLCVERKPVSQELGYIQPLRAKVPSRCPHRAELALARPSRDGFRAHPEHFRDLSRRQQSVG